MTEQPDGVGERRQSAPDHVPPAFERRGAGHPHDDANPNGRTQSDHPDRNLALELVRVTEYAALAAARMVGMGDKEGADQAAVDAMRMVLDTVRMDGVVVIGEGEKDG